MDKGVETKTEAKLIESLEDENLSDAQINLISKKLQILKMHKG